MKHIATYARTIICQATSVSWHQWMKKRHDQMPVRHIYSLTLNAHRTNKLPVKKALHLVLKVENVQTVQNLTVDHTNINQTCVLYKRFATNAYKITYPRKAHAMFVAGIRTSSKGSKPSMLFALGCFQKKTKEQRSCVTTLKVTIRIQFCSIATETESGQR